MKTAKRLGTCWIWPHKKDKDGYGVCSFGGGSKRVHRLIYEKFYGLDAGKIIMHKCDNPSCFRPTHLRAGTHQDNVRDCMHKLRFATLNGELNGMAALTAVKVRSIRKQYKRKQHGIQKLATQHNVSIATISRAINRKLWRHI